MENIVIYRGILKILRYIERVYIFVDTIRYAISILKTISIFSIYQVVT